MTQHLTVSDKMRGTGGSYDYTVVAAFSAGKVGYKNLGSEGIRVRVEPTKQGDTLPFPANWSTPGKGEYENRYSIVIQKGEQFAAAVAIAVGILTTASLS